MASDYGLWLVAKGILGFVVFYFGLFGSNSID